MHEDIITKKKTEREWKLWKPYRTTCTFVLRIRNVNFILASTVHAGWRCTVSDYDIIGPYFSSACGFGVKFILASLFETMHVFLQCGFKTKPLHVMEQAQPNPLDGWLDTEHMETRHQGAQMTSMLRVKTWFLNPFTNEKVFTPYAHRTRLAHCMLLFHY